MPRKTLEFHERLRIEDEIDRGVSKERAMELATHKDIFVRCMIARSTKEREVQLTIAQRGDAKTRFALIYNRYLDPEVLALLENDQSLYVSKYAKIKAKPKPTEQEIEKEREMRRLARKEATLTEILRRLEAKLPVYQNRIEDLRSNIQEIRERRVELSQKYARYMPQFFDSGVPEYGRYLVIAYLPESYKNWIEKLAGSESFVMDVEKAIERKHPDTIHIWWDRRGARFGYHNDRDNSLCIPYPDYDTDKACYSSHNLGSRLAGMALRDVLEIYLVKVYAAIEELEKNPGAFPDSKKLGDHSFTTRFNYESQRRGAKKLSRELRRQGIGVYYN